MTWQKPELISDREIIADKILFPNQKRYCCRRIAWWVSLLLPFMEIFDSEDPEKCGYCYGCMDDSERMVRMEEEHAIHALAYGD